MEPGPSSWWITSTSAAPPCSGTWCCGLLPMPPIARSGWGSLCGLRKNTAGCPGSRSALPLLAAPGPLMRCPAGGDGRWAPGWSKLLRALLTLCLTHPMEVSMWSAVIRDSMDIRSWPPTPACECCVEPAWL